MAPYSSKNQKEEAREARLILDQILPLLLDAAATLNKDP